MRTFYLVSRWNELNISTDDMKSIKEITLDDAMVLAHQWAADEGDGSQFVYEVTIKPVRRVDVNVTVETSEVQL